MLAVCMMKAGRSFEQVNQYGDCCENYAKTANIIAPISSSRE
jgi:hypothetical protein